MNEWPSEQQVIEQTAALWRERDEWKQRAPAAEELAASYAATNDTQRKRMEKMQAQLNAAVQRAEAAEARAVTWTPVTECLPDSLLRVLAVYKSDHTTTTIRAIHIGHHEVDCSLDYEEAIYDEKTDHYYYPEGWYEAMENGEFAFIGPVEGVVTHWAKLPPLPPRG